jgi:hypothetical protein
MQQRARATAKIRIDSARMSMKTIVLLMLFCSAQAIAADCVTNRYGKVVCANGQKAVKVNPNTGTAATAQKKCEWRDNHEQQQGWDGQDQKRQRGL